MKVDKIETYQAKDGNTRWKVSFEDNDKPLIMGWQPSFEKGAIIPEDKIQLTAKGERQYYIWKKESGHRKKSKDTPERQKSMCLSYAKDLCVAGKIELKDILGEATKFYEWVAQ